jgi:hypothetical protein
LNTLVPSARCHIPLSGSIVLIVSETFVCHQIGSSTVSGALHQPKSRRCVMVPALVTRKDRYESSSIMMNRPSLLYQRKSYPSLLCPLAKTKSYIMIQTDPLCYHLCLLRSPDFVSFLSYTFPQAPAHRCEVIQLISTESRPTHLAPY